VLHVLEKNGAKKSGEYKLKIVASGRKKETNTKELNDDVEVVKKAHGLPQSECETLLITIAPFVNELFVDTGIIMNIYPSPCYFPFAQHQLLAYVTRFIILNHAHNTKVNDSIVCTESNIILESALSNIFWIKEKSVYFPDRSLPYYYGAAIECLLDYLKSLNYEVKSGFYQLNDISEDSFVYRISSFAFDSIITIEEKKFLRNLEFESELKRGFNQYKNAQSWVI